VQLPKRELERRLREVTVLKTVADHVANKATDDFQSKIAGLAEAKKMAGRHLSQTSIPQEQHHRCPLLKQWMDDAVMKPIILKRKRSGRKPHFCSRGRLPHFAANEAGQLVAICDTCHTSQVVELLDS
jgi:hypothetical protein